jgi:hypothetical protein
MPISSQTRRIAVLGLALGVGTLLSTASCTSGQDRLSQPFGISVRVVDADTGLAMPATRVWLEEFRPGKGLEMGHFAVVSATATGLNGEAYFRTTDPRAVQVGAAPCEDFLAQGMTVVPQHLERPAGAMAITVRVNSRLCHSVPRPNNSFKPKPLRGSA